MPLRVHNGDRLAYHRAWRARHPAYWSPATEHGRALNVAKAAYPCNVPYCPRPRYVSPSGDARSRCPEHEAARARERYAARVGAVYRPRLAGRGARVVI